MNLASAGKLTLIDTSYSPELKDYLFSARTIWFWLVLCLDFASIITTLTIHEEMFPQVYARYIFGSIFVFLTPGFCLIKALFPNNELDNFEMILTSIATSLAVVTLIAFLLNLTPSGINLLTISISILPFTMTCATVGLIRAHTHRITAHSRA